MIIISLVAIIIFIAFVINGIVIAVVSSNKIWDDCHRLDGILASSFQFIMCILFTIIAHKITASVKQLDREMIEQSNDYMKSRIEMAVLTRAHQLQQMWIIFYLLDFTSLFNVFYFTITFICYDPECIPTKVPIIYDSSF